MRSLDFYNSAHSFDVRLLQIKSIVDEANKHYTARCPL